MCAVPRHLLSLHVLPEGFLCSLSRELMLICLYWYFLLEEGDVSLSPAMRNFPQWAWTCWRWWESGRTLVSSLGILPGFVELHPIGLSAFPVSFLYCDKFLLLQILLVGLGQWEFWGWTQRWKAHWVPQNFLWPLSLDLQFQAYFVCANGLYDVILNLQMSLLICWLFFFSLQLPLRGCAQHPLSITTRVALGVKLDLAGLKEVLFLLRQATGTGQVRMAFQFYSVCHHWTSENFSLLPNSVKLHRWQG